MNLLEELKNINLFEEDNLFKGATEDEVKQRKKEHLKAIIEDAGFTKNPDGTITVEGDLNLSQKQLKSLLDLPYKIREVKGHFDCSNNKLTSLEGAPKVVGGDFYCDYNKLTSLEGAPKVVGGDFYCGYNNLTSLKGSPEIVKGDFYCSDNNLTSLEGAPKIVGGDFYCDYNSKKFTKEDVDVVSAVEGEILV